MYRSIYAIASFILIWSFPAKAIEGTVGASADNSPPGCDFVELGGSMTPTLKSKNYNYRLLQCNNSTARKGLSFRLWLIESGLVVNELILPSKKLGRNLFLEMACGNRKYETSPDYDIGAIGLLAAEPAMDDYEVVNIVWAWRLDPKPMRLSLIKSKGIRCYSPNGD